ncbi:Regulator of telomere elongation helicase 1 [Desmophyllum pertusum]|uniref:Regulator of telomere elongation helicase 1 n=1 Tax=Desmophyllum pertusum TaxID=174260 RepID=A0A9W9YE97_9CNID|nr:Regulator of telomere elongation helicase 1 [Desmophyllum pertusum]
MWLNCSLSKRLTTDQGGSNYVQALGEELQQAAKGDSSWGTSDNDKRNLKIQYTGLKSASLALVNNCGINNEVLKQDTNSAKVHMCRAKVQARTCHFYNNLEANKANKDFTLKGILDSRRSGGTWTKATVKKANNVDISGSIILFDEAHNLEKTCEETASFDLTSFDIASCIEDVAQCIEFIECREHNELDTNEAAADVDVDKEDLARLKSLFIELEKLIDVQELPKNGDGLTKPGSFMFELLSKLNITYSTKDQVLEVMDKCTTLLVGDTKKFKGKHFALQKFSDAMQVVFSKDATHHSSV